MKVFIDGSGSPLPGQRGRTAVVIEYGVGEEPDILVKTHGNHTNNEMEYAALYEALSMPEVRDCTIYTDSRLLVGQVVGSWKVRAANLKEAHARCKELLGKKNCKLMWVPRERNLAGRLLEGKTIE